MDNHLTKADLGPLNTQGKTPPKKQRSLPNLAVGQGPNGGWECATLSFPVADIRRQVGCRLPDAILHGQRSCFIRPHSRAVQRLAHAEFRVRPLSSLGPVVAPPACEPGRDTFVTWAPRLDQLAPGRPLLLAVRWPGATGLTSYLSGCLSLTSQRCVFETSPAFWKCFGPGRGPHPSRNRKFSLSAFRRLWFGGFLGETARALRSVLAHSSNRVPLRVTVIHSSPKPARVT